MPIGRPIAYKLGLLGLTLLLALHARLRLVPRLDSSRLPWLALHIAAVTALAVMLVLVGLSIRLGLGW